MGRPTGRARVSTQNPDHFAVCDRCGIWYNGSALSWQFEYAGRGLTNLRLLVCSPCLENPNPQLTTRTLKADPPPVMNARTENFAVDNA